MNKRLIYLTLAAMITIPSLVHAGATEEEKDNIEKYVRDRNKINIELLDGEALSKFSSTRFFKVEVVEKKPGGATMTETLMLVKEGDELNPLGFLGSTMRCEQLMKVFDKKMIISENEDAKAVEAALDLIYPVDNFDQVHKKIYKEGDQWTFIRGDIFDNLKGFQFTVNNEGVVTAINYTTGIKKSRE